MVIQCMCLLNYFRIVKDLFRIGQVLKYLVQKDKHIPDQIGLGLVPDEVGWATPARPGAQARQSGRRLRRKRKFTYRHLAQLKHILPEAVQVDKILIHDEETMCMNPTLKLSLLFDVVEGHHEQSNFIALCKVFASRLYNFCSTHPEGCEIPEAVLPEPFNQRSITMPSDSLPLHLSTESLPTSIETKPINSFCLHPSFSKHFSRKNAVAETQNFISPVSLSSIGDVYRSNQDVGIWQLKTSLNPCSQPTIITNPVELTYPLQYFSSGTCENTPMKLQLEAGHLMVETPVQSTPKRSIPSSDGKLKTMTIPDRTPCNMSAKRSLNFSCLEGEEGFLNSITDEIEQYKVVEGNVSSSHAPLQECAPLPSSAPPGSLGCWPTKHLLAAPAARLAGGALVEVNSCCSAKDHRINPSGLVLQKRLSASLSDLVALIHQIFRSVNCSSITKEELMHKIIIQNCDIVERGEVEDQLELLEKLVPDWICRNLAPSGDLLYKWVYHPFLIVTCHIKGGSDLNSVCERLTSI
ncbi:unnamed protein product [Ilex paraguariensis]|uniref:DNA replication factor Cdt1 C-terminal domain-containing protein n=1 Tax=Ilex paraguariensis TaxID=185542 RepID=A0ABC8RPI8_9AQUA